VGPDGLDETVVSEPFTFPAAVDPRGWRIGVVDAAFEKHAPLRGALDELRSFGCELVPVELPTALVDDYWLILDAEAAASFDDMTRDGRIREMVRDEDEAWPNVFRAARLIPAVDYVRAQRVRRQLMLDLDAAMRDVDLLVHPSEEDATLTIENMAGQPAVALPWGSRPNGAPDSIALAAHLDREMDLLGFAIAWQSRTDHHRRHPSI
jgi:Asp-tRNA(Asn)/Glu-tRNA(Gln) amidotransferase A subunit family amidase